MLKVQMAIVKMQNRDNFSSRTRQQIAKRAGWLCSFPGCRAPTVGATSDDGEGVIDIGTAAHICAAAPGGPRYNEKQSPEERSSVKNGIWMCRDHGKAIDSTDSEFTVEQLLEWKKQAEIESRKRVLRNESPLPPIVTTDAQLTALIRAAAEADLRVFRNTAKWPITSVALTLNVDGFNEPVSTSALASAVTSLDDLILVAPPGMGKTTTLFQIAEGVLSRGNGMPLVIPLGEWATESASILGSILNRPAFRAISEDDLRKVAAQPGVVLLLDGWNELDAPARNRARVQVAKLKAELPELGLVVSTRKQTLDVPFTGIQIDLLPLNEEQQVQIAIAMRGDAGAKIVDQAWRTPGVRDLVAIPLYLTALLSLPENEPFPTTMEAVLGCFVAAQENEASHTEALYAVVQGFQPRYLEGLSVFATLTANTAITDANARQSISRTATLLVDNGQLADKPNPNAVLDVLVSNHVLMRAGDTLGYSFQHQQFQEWYASHWVEHRIITEIADFKGRTELKTDIFNMPVWEEAILFAVERLARGDTQQRTACGEAIIAAFEVDPILAAEMIFRSTEEVWEQIARTVQGLVAHWHTPGKADRAVRFMLTSGRPEFFNAVWPLITDENTQISLKALRNCRRFRPAILGKNAEKKIRDLSPHVRSVLMSEIAFRGSIDGLDLASIIAKSDPDPEVQASIVEALAFRRADRHIVEVLQEAGDKTFDLIARRDIIDKVDNEHIQKGLAAARARYATAEKSANDELRTIVYAQGAADHSAKLTDIISKMEIDRQQDVDVRLIHEASKRYPLAVANGLLARVRAGRTLFYGSDDILASAGLALEDDVLLQVALANSARRDDRAEAAASVLGPEAVGRLVDTLLDVGSRLRVDGQYDHEASGKFGALQSIIAHVPGGSLVTAVLARSARANNEQMAQLAGLLSRHPGGKPDSSKPFDAATRAAIQNLIDDWGNRMLASGDAKRWQAAEIATLASRVPSVSMLPILKRLLEDNLRRYQEFRKQAELAGWRHGDAVNEARSPMTSQYQWAFSAIRTPETASMMKDYLTDVHFGEVAARVLTEHWRSTQEPPKNKHFFGSVDFSEVEARRALRASNPDATSAEAELIFGAIESLIADGTTEEQKRLAVTLGTVALPLPHGQRDNTIQKLITIASRRTRSNLLLPLVLSGEQIDTKIVIDGISETLEAAKTQSWILTQSDGYELKSWLRLLPFVKHPMETLTVVRGLPTVQRDPKFLEEMVSALGEAPSEEAEEVLFGLAQEDSRFYLNRQWSVTALRFGTLSSARRIIDLTATGMFDGIKDDWHFVQEIGSLIANYSDLRIYVYNLLKGGPISRGLTMLACAVAENPDEDGLLLLVRFEIELKRSFLSWQSVERVITKYVPAKDWEGPYYDVVPVPASGLRQKLLALTTDGGPADVAARYLRMIDKIRDEHGIQEAEPRHPDLASGKSWPIIKPDPNVLESLD